MTGSIGKEQVAGRRDGAAMLDGREHVSERPAAWGMEVNAIGCDQRHASHLGELDPLCQISLIVWAAMKFPQ